MGKINVCLACDDNYSKYAGVVIASVLVSSASEDDLHFYILDGGIKEDSKNKINELKTIKDCEITFVNIEESLFEDYKRIKTHAYITLPAYYRLKMASLLADVDRIIYFDCDVVVNSSLKALFYADLGACPFAGVRDINKRKLKKNPGYINPGVLVMDLKNMREQNIENVLLDWTRENIDVIKMGDQEIINEALKGNIKVLADEWNVQSSNFVNRSSYTKNPKVIHYVSRKKPWHWASFSYHRDLYFKYLQFTPWKLSEKEYTHWTRDNKIAARIAYLKYRPFFFLRPRFYVALYHTYIESFICKKLVIKNNTFVVWEPCSKSHSEVVPGYVKYLLDSGYHVSVLVHPDRLKEGLFARFKDENISLNKMSRKQVCAYLKRDDLFNIKGLMVTTVGKLCDEIDFDQAYSFFNENVDRSKILFVAHEAKHAVDNNSWREKNITLRELNYKNAKSVVVNPHYFGDIKFFPKNDITNFVMVGAIKPYKKNDNTIIEAVLALEEKGIKNFKVTVIGKGHIKNIPANIRKYFDFKGRLPFDKMYDELERADFLLTAYDTDNEAHVRYNTTGTSGNFQLVYGFIKPVIIIEEFANINGFTNSNSILYKTNDEYSDAMIKAVEMSKKDYQNMQNSLKEYSDKLYSESLANLRTLIDEK